MAKQEQVRLNMTPEAKRLLDQISDHYGMSQTAMASRIFRWFVDQDEVVQACALGVMPEKMIGTAAEMFMREMAKKHANETDQNQLRVAAKESSRVKGSERKGPK